MIMKAEKDNVISIVYELREGSKKGDIVAVRAERALGQTVYGVIEK